jgi:type IV secretory pathway TraG/TraD family ATPase VirD4
MTAVLGRSDFRFTDLKRRNISVFLVLPPDRLSTYSRWRASLSRKACSTWPAIRPNPKPRCSSAG